MKNGSGNVVFLVIYIEYRFVKTTKTSFTQTTLDKYVVRNVQLAVVAFDLNKNHRQNCKLYYKEDAKTIAEKLWTVI